jgi:hypothetical protein
MVDQFTHLVITQLSDVTKLTAKLRSSKLRALLTAKTRTISIELGEVDRSAKLKRLCGLLKWVNQAESVSIQDCSVRGWTYFGLSSSSNVVDALASFAILRHFAFDQGPARSLRHTLVSVRRINESVHLSRFRSMAKAVRRPSLAVQTELLGGGPSWSLSHSRGATFTAWRLPTPPRRPLDHVHVSKHCLLTTS